MRTSSTVDSDSHRPIPRVFVLVIVVLANSLVWAQGPPVAAIHDVVDTYFGQRVTDPYRWMETGESNPEMVAYVKAQDDYTNSVLTTLSGREKLLARISALDQAGTPITSVQQWGGRYFYLKREPGAEGAKLCVRDSLKGAERVLVDPDKMSTQHSHYAVDFYQPSLDGKLVAYGLSEGGSEESVIHVVDSATGFALPDQIDRCIYSYASWYPGGKSFFYFRVNKLPADAPPAMRFKKLRAYWHKLGTDPEKDPAIFGYGISKDVPFDEDTFPSVIYSPAAPFLIATAVHGVRKEETLYAAPLPKRIVSGSIQWRKIADEADDIVAIDVHDDDAFLLTHHDASRYRIIRTSLSHPDLAHAKVVVPQDQAVITAINVAADGLYFTLMDGGVSHVRRVGFGGGASSEVPLPFQGAVLDRSVDPMQPGIMMLLTSWTRPPVWIAYDSGKAKTTDTGLAPPWPVDFSNVTSVEVKAKSHDGTMIPLSIVYKRGIGMDGSHPTLLTGYGAYGISLLPTFEPTRLAWLERGGVLAFAHVRGGGEYGDDWHRAGMKAMKVNSVADVLACAQYLIDNKYTSPLRLSGSGRSAGGLLIGDAITQHPELFGAALILVGLSNPLRLEVTQGGAANTPEFGSPASEEGFRALYDMDAYQHVRPNTAYPAVLLTAGFNDARVSIWQPAKMTARLQAFTSSGKPVLLRVAYEAGHGFGSTRAQLNQELTDQWSFLFWQLGDPEFQPKKDQTKH